MNLMARLIGERHHSRQNQQRDQYPTESATHSQARLTAVVTGCQERRCAGVPNDAEALMMDSSIVTDNSHRSAGGWTILNFYRSTMRSSVLKNSGYDTPAHSASRITVSPSAPSAATAK